MEEVVKANFKTLLPEIIQAVHAADFFAIDTEFTGLSHDSLKPNLSDDGKTRYDKHRKAVSDFTLLEVGLACFTEKEHQPLNKGQARYSAKVYNFVVFPYAFGPIDVRFSCQSSSMRFNVAHDVDLNRFVRDGISYLNQSQLNQVQKVLELKSWCEYANAYNVNGAIKRICDYVNEWWCDGDEDWEAIRVLTFQKIPRLPFTDHNSRADASSKPPVTTDAAASDNKQGVDTEKQTGNIGAVEAGKDNTLVLDDQVLRDLGATDIPLYILMHELRARLANALNLDIRLDTAKQAIVIQWLGHNKAALDPNHLDKVSLRDQEDCKACLEELHGFSMVIDELIRSKKPLIGHNCLLDILFFYEKLHSTLPVDYVKFKQSVHELFPTVFDTKWIAFTLMRTLENRYLERRYDSATTGARSAENGSQSNNGNQTHKLRMLNFASVLNGSLGGLFNKLAKQVAINSPVCYMETPDGRGVPIETEISKHAHRAGIDALMTGVVFLRIAHIAALESFYTQLSKGALSELEINTLLDEQPFSFRHYVAAIEALDCTNRLNVIYGAIRHMRLDGADPPASPPTMLLVEPAARKSSPGVPLDLLDLTRRIMPFGSFEIEVRDARSARLVVGSAYTSRRLLEYFGRRSQSDASFRLVPYTMLNRVSGSRLRHATWLCMAVGLVGAGLAVSSFIKKP